MRLLDESGKQIFFAYTFFTRNEAKEMIRQLQELLEDGADNDVHFFDEEHSWYSTADVWEKMHVIIPRVDNPDAPIPQIPLRELRLCIYDYDALSAWSKPIQDLLTDYSGKIQSVDMNFSS